MDEWLEQYARALHADLGAAGDVDLRDLTTAESETMLDLARFVAHQTERKNAPLSSYLAGRYVAARMEAGASPGEAAADARRIAEELLGQAPG